MRIGDFTIAEVLNEIKTAFALDNDIDEMLLRELSDYKKKDTFEKFTYCGKEYLFSNKKTTLWACASPCLEFMITREDGKFFTLEHQIKVLVSREQCELLERLTGFHLTQKHDSCIIVSTPRDPFFLRDSNTVKSPVRRYNVAIGQYLIIDRNWTIRRTLDELRKHLRISPNFYNLVLFEREQILVRHVLDYTHGDLINIVLNNILDQGQLLQYRRLI